MSITIRVALGWGQVQLTKYSSTPSTPNIYQVQVLVKYSFCLKVLKYIKYFLTKYSTSTHIKIGSKVGMDIQSRVNFGWIKQKSLPQIMSWLKSQFRWPYSMQSGFWMDKIKGLSPNHVSAQKSRWPYSMQSKFGMDKIQGSYKLEWLYGFRIYFHIT